MPEFRFSLGWGDKSQRHQLDRQVLDHLPRLYRMARGMTDQPGDAEDLVHDTCVKALSAGQDANLSNKPAFCAYLNRILVNTYRDSYRRRRSSPVRPLENHHSPGSDHNVVEMVISAGSSPVERINRDDSSMAINQALTNLPPEVRVVTVLFLISGLSYKDIADITDCPIGTVMSRLARGRKQLRKELSGFKPGEGEYPSTSNEGREK